jgi:uncharacterized protein YcbX
MLTVPARVAWLSIAPVKGLRLLQVDEIHLDRDGAHGDRRFVITDSEGHLANGKHLGPLLQIVAECAAPFTTLTMRFPDGTTVSGEPWLGAPTTMVAHGETRTVRPVIGPWSASLSAWVGRELRLAQVVCGGDGADRRREGGVTILSTGSVAALATAANLDHVDARRFRMTVGIDCAEPFVEEAWIGHVVTVGEASVHIHGNVGRCVVTTLNPQTGEVDLPTLHLLRHLRDGVESTEPLPFGVWGEVIGAGRVRVGDPVTLS